MQKNNTMVRKHIILSILVGFFLLSSCSKKSDWVDNSIDIAAYQLDMMANEISDSAKLPRSIKNGKIRLENIYDWTSGFFPGSLWYTYEFTKDEKFKSEALKYTHLLYDLKDYTGTHDLGFMVYCSYVNACLLYTSRCV